MRLFRLAVAALLAIGVVLNFVVFLSDPALPGGGSIVNFFSFFTILVTLMLIAAMALPVLAPASVAGAYLFRPSTRGGLLLYTVVVGLVYAIVLRQLWNPTGLHAVADAIVHDAAPVLTVIDWVVFVPRGRLSWRDAVAWLAVPAVYGAYTLAHGAVSGFYPYPFLDAGVLGVEAVLATMAVFAAGFLALGLGIVAVDHIGASRRTM